MIVLLYMRPILPRADPADRRLPDAVPVGQHLLSLGRGTNGAHVVFGQHGPAVALAFGVLIVFVVVSGSMWIMADLNQNMLMPSDGPMTSSMRR